MIIETAAALFIMLAVEWRLERVRWTRDRVHKIRSLSWFRKGH